MQGRGGSTNGAVTPFTQRARVLMNTKTVSFCTWLTVLLFVFALLSPEEACCFDTDTLKTTGIIMGITFGVALVVVLLVGTIRDIKKGRGGGDEDEDVWTRSPVLRTLGTRFFDYRLFGGSPCAPEGTLEESRAALGRMDFFPQGRIRTIGLANPLAPPMQGNPSVKGVFPGGVEHPAPKPPGARGSVSPSSDKVALSHLPALGAGCSHSPSVPAVD